jgi:hypothetical protein
VSTPEPGIRPDPTTQSIAQPPAPWPPGAPPPTPPGPAGPKLPTKPATPASRGGGVAALALIGAVLALILAAGSALFSFTAMTQANDAKQLAGKQANDPGTNPGQRPRDTAGDPSPTAEAPPPDPNATVPPTLGDDTLYTVEYTKQSLTMTARCNYSMHVDLDEPRSDVESNGSDFSFTRGCMPTDPSKFGLGNNVDASMVGTPNMDPRDCADKIRTSPVGDANIPVRKGMAICLTTSYPAARARGDRWRLVLILVTGVAEDGAVTIEASAWNAPS